MTVPNLDIPHDRLADFCRKWKIVELSLFGSVLREDFGPKSDVDVMVVFAPDADWDYFDRPDMQDELREMFGGRPIDLVERRLIRNPHIRHRALTTRQVVYAA